MDPQEWHQIQLHNPRVHRDGLEASVLHKYSKDLDTTVLSEGGRRVTECSDWAKTTTELNYGKVDGESLGGLSCIKEHHMYLYGIKFTCVVDHELLVPLYNSHSR